MALSTAAEGLWFTDCDVLFGSGCLDGLAAALGGRVDPLVFPPVELLTELLPEEELTVRSLQLREAAASAPLLHDPTAAHAFVPVPVPATKAKGPLQIRNAHVARAVGYCRDLAANRCEEPTFAKCHEDTAFRWLLGTHGVPVDVPGVSRIRHQAKGLYPRAAPAAAVSAPPSAASRRSCGIRPEARPEIPSPKPDRWSRSDGTAGLAIAGEPRGQAYAARPTRPGAGRCCVGWRRRRCRGG